MTRRGPAESRPGSSDPARTAFREALVGSLSLLVIAVAAPAAAQQRPLVTEDPEVIGAGSF